MRIALIGANGQLGSDLRRRLAGTLIPLTRPEVDVGDQGSVEAALRRVKPDFVINCAAMTDVDACEDQSETAFRVNALGAGCVAKHAARLNAAVVYLSTDYVFGRGGERHAPYTETDLPGPVNTYGASKLAGEHLTGAYNPRHIIVRACGLYGRAGARGKGGNFVETIRRLAREGKPLRIVADQRLSPTSTWELAGRIGQLIQAGANGLYHVAAADSCTWHQFAQMIVEAEGLTTEVVPIRSDEYPRKARRPVMSALASTRLDGIAVEPCPTCREMVFAYLQSAPCGASA